MINIVKKHWLGFLLSIVWAQAVGIASSILSGDVVTKYNHYIKPALAAPDWLFGLAWPILYTLMGFSAYLFYLRTPETSLRRKGVLLYLVQLFFNFLWSIIFFRYDMILMALLVSITLVITVSYMLIVFDRQDRVASHLVMPYFAWLLYATYLNYGIFILNH